MRAIAGLGDHREVVTAPQPAYECAVLGARGPRGDRRHAAHVGISLQHRLRTREQQRVDLRARIGAPQRAYQRRGEEHIAEIAQRDDEDCLRRGQPSGFRHGRRAHLVLAA